MRIMKRALTVAALVIATTARLNAQAHPSFVGTWVMDPTKTVVEGGGGAPSAATRVVVQHGDTLIVENEATSEAGVQKTHLIWGTDGKPWKNKVPVQGEDTEVSTVLTWEGATLVIRSTIPFQGMSVEQTDRWTLAADGKSMTTARTVTAEGEQVAAATFTYVKKP